MARGRFLNNTVCKDKEVNDLSNDTCRLLFTWLISHADREGRVYGDPALVKSLIFPRRTDIELDEIETYLQELHDVGLIIWYEALGDKFILFPGFEKNQVGLRKEREPESELPPPSDDILKEYIRIFTGKKPDICRMLSPLILSRSLIEVKEEVKAEVKAEGKSSTPATPPGDYIMRVISKVTGLVSITDDTEKVIPAIEGLYYQHNRDEAALIEYLAPFYQEWISRKGKDGRKYQRTNFAWLYQWAVAGEIPEPSKNGSGKEEKIDDKVAMLLERAKNGKR